VRDSPQPGRYEVKGGRMDNDPEVEPPVDGQTPAEASEAPPLSSPTNVPAATSRSGRRAIPFTLLAILTIAAVLAALFAVRGSTAPSEALASAMNNSLHLKSAAFTMSVGIAEAGSTATITSEGTTSFVTSDTRQAMQIVSGSQRISEQVVSDGPEIYVHLVGGIIAKIAPGKSWVSVPSGQSAGSSVAQGGVSGNTDAILKVLSSPGNYVSDLGSSHEDGHDVHLYSVHLTRSQINSDIAKEHLPQFMRQAVALIHIPAVTYTLAINGANQLTQLRAALHLQTDGQSVTEHITEGFSHYGAKVTVTAPPANEVIPLQKFLQIAQKENQRVTI
jgi:hypothetical protein